VAAPTSAYLIDKVLQAVQDTSFDRIDDVLAAINRGLIRTALRVQVPSLIVREPAPGFTIAAGQNVVTGPTTMLKHVLHAWNETAKCRVKIHKSLSLFLSRYPSMDETGHVTEICVKVPNRIFCHPAPAANQVLNPFIYLSQPTLFTRDGDETLDWLEPSLQVDLLTNYAAAHLFNLKEDGIADSKENTKLYLALYEGAVAELAELVGEPEVEPDFVPGGEGDHFDIDNELL
jgi:hypothetical protein